MTDSETPPTLDTILDCPLGEGWTGEPDEYGDFDGDHYGGTFVDAGLTEPYTLRAYFSALVVAALEETHGWAKRPFGNSGWDYSLGLAIEQCGVTEEQATDLLLSAARRLAVPPVADGTTIVPRSTTNVPDRFSLLGIIRGLMLADNLGDVRDEIDHLCDLAGVARPEGGFVDGWTAQDQERFL